MRFPCRSDAAWRRMGVLRGWFDSRAGVVASSAYQTADGGSAPMLTRTRTLLLPPQFGDDDAKNRAASIVYPLLLLLLVAFGSDTLLALALPAIMARRLILVLPAVLIILALLMAVRRGHMRF